jgi:hypothetical protein
MRMIGRTKLKVRREFLIDGFLDVEPWMSYGPQTLWTNGTRRS